MRTSLRDPGGHVCLIDDRVIRVVNDAGLFDLQAFLGSPVSAHFLQSQKLVNTLFLDPQATAQILQHNEVRRAYEQSQGAAIVEHERVPFSSFPYEWPAAINIQRQPCTSNPCPIVGRAWFDGFSLNRLNLTGFR